MNPARLARVLAFHLALLTIASAGHAGSRRGPTCDFPDLTDMTPIALAPNAAPAAGTGGDIPGGRWELVAVRYANSPLPITGEALGALELDATGPTSGYGSLALNVSITSPVSEEIDETGAGPYSATGTMLDFENECGSEGLLGEAEYSVDTSGTEPVMTLWGDLQVDTFTILIETEFRLVEPSEIDDPVFEDRFEPF